MAKSKKINELERNIKIANYQTILRMRDDNWCDGCNEDVENCLLRGKCKGQEDIENAKQKNI